VTAGREVNVKIRGVGKITINWGNGTSNNYYMLWFRDKNFSCVSFERERTITIYGSYITYLDCSKNKLTNLEIDENRTLEWLNCCANKLTHLNTSKNSSLKELYCGDNKLIELNLNNNGNLTVLDCRNNKLTKLNIGKNYKLTKLICRNNNITNLDIKANDSLSILDWTTVCIGDTIKGYEIVEELSSGNFCNTFLAIKNQQKYFFKEYTDPTTVSCDFEEFAENQRIMISLLNSLGNNIEKIVEDFIENHRYYQVKEFIDGKSLVEFLTTSLSQSSRKSLIIMMCDIIESIHKVGIIHRDLNPNQFMVVSDSESDNENFRLILTDFDWSVPNGRIIRNNIYTVGYSCADKTITYKSDIFTLGVMISEVLYKQDTRHDPEISDIIVRCLSPDPKKRPEIEEIKEVFVRYETDVSGY